MKKIIVATDYSATASNALQFGASLAQAFESNLVLFNVYNPGGNLGDSPMIPDEIDHVIKNNEALLEKLRRETAQRYGIDVSWVGKTGETIGQLEDYAGAVEADLVVMGIDSDLMGYKLFGNTTTAAVRRLTTPILIVPNDVQFKGIRKILYACEYAYLGADNHLDLLKEIALKFKAQLQVFHVETKRQIPVTMDDEIGAMNVLMEDLDHTFSFVKYPSVREGILKGLEVWDADLLVMVPHKPGFWESLLKGSTTREMALRTRVPLLVLPNVV